MKIKKIYQGELPENKILNAQSTSQTDTYSCDYINNLSNTKSIISIVGGGEKTYTINDWVWTPVEFTYAFINIGDGFSYSAADHGIKVLKDMTIRVESQICYFGTANGEINVRVTKNTNNVIGYSNRFDTFNNGSSTVNITGRLATVNAGDIIQLSFSGAGGTYKINQNDVLTCLTIQEL